uniref:Serine protease n=1 Tax=Mlepnos solemo-like virus TaxID=2716737 RepID=A0A6G7PSA9_9VIRU|nr:hypothetical protein [Mlepnos solemo-like virus]
MFAVEEIAVTLALLILVALISLLFSICAVLRRWDVERKKNAEVLVRPESTRAGSPFCKADLITGTFAVYGVFENRKDKIYMGNGFVYEGYLITCTHVLADIRRFSGTPWLCYYEKNDFSRKVMYDLKDLEWQEILPDVSITMKPNKLMMPNAKIGAVHGPIYGRVVATHGDNNASYGLLTPTSDRVFGSLEYTGSTRDGFSGSVYAWNDTILGMHSSGGGVNRGVAAKYIAANLFRFENSDRELLKRMFTSGEEYQWQLKTPDEVQVYYRGEFYMFDRQDFDDMYEEHGHWDDDERPRKGKARSRKARKHGRRHKEEVIYESAKMPQPDLSTTTGSSDSESSTDSMEDFLPRSLIQDTSPNLALQAIACPAQSTSATQTSDSIQRDMDGLKRTVQQLNDRLQSSSNTEKELRELIESLRKENERLRSAGPSKETRSPSTPQDSTTSISKFDEPYERWIQEVQQVWESLSPIQQLAMRSDGMVFVIHLLQTLQPSLSMSRRGLIACVQKITTDPILQLSAKDRNHLNGCVGAVMHQMRQPTSSSSSKMSPTRIPKLLKAAIDLYPVSHLLTKSLIRSSSDATSNPQ